MLKQQNVQEAYLAELMEDRTQVIMYLMNGFQMRGVIAGFDGFVVMLDTDGKIQMIYKHAISTITPYTAPVPDVF